VNFDEAGFRVGCPKGQYLLVPTDVLQVSSWITILIATLIATLHC
jgi:hypothetical protein